MTSTRREKNVVDIGNRDAMFLTFFAIAAIPLKLGQFYTRLASDVSELHIHMQYLAS